MKDDFTTYDTTTGRIVSPIEEQPVIIIKKGKRKINPLFAELLKSVPQEVKDEVEKAFTCAYLTNGDECSLGGECINALDCTKWKYYKEEDQ